MAFQALFCYTFSRQYRQYVCIWAKNKVDTFGSSGVRSTNSENSRTSSSSSNGGSNNGPSQRAGSQSDQQYQKGCSKTIFLPAERTGAVIGKNGRMKHLIKVIYSIIYICSTDFRRCVTYGCLSNQSHMNRTIRNESVSFVGQQSKHLTTLPD